VNVTVHIENEQAVIELVNAAGSPATNAERAAMSADVARLLQRHLRQRDDTHAHAYPEGGRRSHFWRKAAESVTFEHDDDSIRVSVTHQGAALRYAGAPNGIKPVNAKALAIPAHGSAYGRLPAEFPDLQLVVFRGSVNRAALMLPPRGQEKEGTVMFWLVRKTKPIAPDPTVLPPTAVTLGVAAKRLAAMRARSVSSASGGDSATP
jgi:hypothetical protein